MAKVGQFSVFMVLIISLSFVSLSRIVMLVVWYVYETLSMGWQHHISDASRRLMVASVRPHLTTPQKRTKKRKHLRILTRTLMLRERLIFQFEFLFYNYIIPFIIDIAVQVAYFFHYFQRYIVYRKLSFYVNVLTDNHYFSHFRVKFWSVFVACFSNITYQSLDTLRTICQQYGVICKSNKNAFRSK